MEIKNLQLKNFKCFDSLKVDTKKLTLITGANSSGKSSLLYSVLGAIQSDGFPLQFSPNGKHVRMGDFKDIAYDHNPENNITLDFKYKQRNIDYSVSTEWEEDKIRKLPVLKYLLAETEFYSIEISKKYKYHLLFNYDIEKDPNKKSNSPEFMRRIMASFDSISEEFEEKRNKKTKEKKDPLDAIVARYSNPKKSIKHSFDTIEELNSFFRGDDNFYLNRFFGSIRTSFDEFDMKSNFISSFRLLPERTYYETSKTDLKIGKYGENYVDQIILWESQKSPKIEKLKTVIRDLGLFNDIKTDRLGGGRYELLVKSHKNGVWASITDVGFGISQFLPIIVADIQLGKKSTLFIAQPEIHLHPKVQAIFGNYLIDNINNNNKSYFIETHSEYLINRLRLEIVKDNLNNSDLKVFYIENKGKKSKSHSVRFLKNGQIKGAPKSFFDTYMIDSMNITLEALES